MTVTYAHLCEKAFLSQNGNLNLIGIFESVATQQFPAVFQQLSIVTSLHGIIANHQIIIKIVKADKGEEMTKPIQLNLNVRPEDQEKAKIPQNIRLIGDINNLTIKEAGSYQVEIFLDTEKVYIIPFSVQQAAKPIPKGR
ncbi:MAG: hypothetical protein Q8O95_00060 [bacterium]|nr:hypothetical protein [bacterium]